MAVRTFIEATTPAATPTTRASVMLEIISSRVAGRWTEMASITGMFWRAIASNSSACRPKLPSP